MSQIGSDVTVNTFHTAGDTLSQANYDTIADGLVDFYEAIDGYLSNIFTGELRIKVYRTVDPEPRVPLFQSDHPAAFSGTSPTLPEECAVAISMRAAGTSGTPAGRRRGRVFIGPLSTAVSEYSRTEGTRVTNAARQALAGALVDFVQVTQGAGHPLVVYSRTDGIGRLVEYVSVDDALDTIRSRGPRPTVRHTVGPIT